MPYPVSRHSHLLGPILALAALLAFNFLLTPNFTIEWRDGRLYGSIIDILKKYGSKHDFIIGGSGVAHYDRPKVVEVSMPKLGCLPIVIGLFILFLLAVWLWPKSCDQAEERRKMAADPSYVSKCSSSSRSSGGSWGGYSSGGSHK